MTRSGLLRALPAIAVLVGSGAACAGSDMFGALPGALQASSRHPAEGQAVAIALQVTSAVPLQALKVEFAAPDGCAELKAASARKVGVSLQAGHPTRFATSARVRRTTPCKIVASVVQADGADARTGWVYAVVLNDVPVSHPPYAQGHDAAGRPTIDAVGR